MPGFLIFPLMGVTALYLYHSYQQGYRIIRIRISRGILRRHILSCYALKVKFGSNFTDRGTALVIQNFCLHQTVSLTLINRF